MVKYSANLGFLWTDRPLPEAIEAAAAAGFDAVECHAPYEARAADVRAALDAAGIPMISINTRSGVEGEFGLTAMPGRAVEARLAIDEALRYALAVGAKNVHALAGLAPHRPDAFLTYLGNLRYACKQAALDDITIVIEPLNEHSNPGYYLNNLTDAAGVIDAVDRPNLKLLFDCYHVARTEGDLLGALREAFPMIGHIQFASVPERTEPDHGELDYRLVFALLDELGWDKPLGAEYRPRADVESGLGWMQTLRATQR